MKKNNIYLGLLTLVFCISTNISAQDKKISEQEMTTLRKNAAEKLKGKSYRVKMTSESYRNVNDSAPYYFTEDISEFVPPDSYRDVFERKTVDGTTRSETIRIGKRKFVRLNNQAWKEISETEIGFGSGGGQGKPVESETSVEYTYKGKRFINNQNADLYEILTVREYKDSKSITIYTEKFWFSREGLYLKTENEFGYNKRVTSHTVREYEYDPKIKIEAPILTADQKNRSNP